MELPVLLALAVLPQVLSSHRTGDDLAFVHVPFNFGQTIEAVAISAGTATREEMDDIINAHALLTESNDNTRDIKARGGIVWGLMHPDLRAKQPETGCLLGMTPPKYWPADSAEKYLGGNKTVFGVLRDPFERLVALFRGNMSGYGAASSAEHFKKCDVNAAVKEVMKKYISSGDKFMSGCTYLPQAEYFDGPYGIKLPIDNRRFPDSMNEKLQEWGLSHLHINRSRILHVAGCNDVWAGDLDAETKSLVRTVYARDFDLLCKLFGYCTPNENTCIVGVPQMCPQVVEDWMVAHEAS